MWGRQSSETWRGATRDVMDLSKCAASCSDVLRTCPVLLGLGVRPSIRFIVAGSDSKCFTGAAGPDDIIAVPDFLCDWPQIRYAIVETHGNTHLRESVVMSRVYVYHFSKVHQICIDL